MPSASRRARSVLRAVGRAASAGIAETDRRRAASRCRGVTIVGGTVAARHAALAAAAGSAAANAPVGNEENVLAESAVQDKHVITGTFWEGAKGGVEKQLPELYAGAIRKLVRDNPTISAALSAPPPAQ